MFTTSCFIRKNTFAIRAELSKLGYENSIDSVVGDAIATSQITSHYTTISQKMYDDFNPHSTWSNNRIDCGDNKELFLALAALRDDTDKYQWFYSTGWTNFEGNPLPDKWVFCDQDTLEHFAWVNNSPNSYKTGWKKANVEELINHFSKDE